MNRLFYRSILGSGSGSGSGLGLIALFAGTIITALTFLIYAPVARAQSPAPVAGFSHKPGTLVRDGQTIFLIAKGYKQGFSSLNEFLTYKYRLSRIVMANLGDKQLTEGPPKRAKPGSLVLDSVDHRTVYLIGKQGEKRGIATPAAYWRYKKPSIVLWSIDLSNYPVGDIIE